MSTNKKSSSLPNDTVEYLKAWMMSPEHIAHPYPTDSEKAQIMKDTGIELKQLTNWFVNNRKRYWKPRVEAKLQEQVLLGHAPSGALQGKGEAATKSGTSASASPKGKIPRSVSLLNNSEQSTPEGPERSCKGFSQITDNLSVTKWKSSNGKGSTSVSDFSNVSDVSALPSLHHDHRSAVSVTDSGVSQQSSDDEWSAVQVNDGPSKSSVKSEMISIHILRPDESGSSPQLSDVTVLPFFPKERILRTFRNCSIAYDCSFEPECLTMSNREMLDLIQTRRDIEITRMKQKCLSNYTKETQVSCQGHDHHVTSENSESLKRKRESETSGGESGQTSCEPKCRRVSVDLGKVGSDESLGRYANDALPTIEEAAQLFGFARAIHESTKWGDSYD